jgi:hypothetical protein
MDGSAFNTAWDGIVIGFIVLAILAPFGLWKLVEVALWLFAHLRVGFA